MNDPAMVRRVRNRIGQSLRLRFALSIAVVLAVVGGAIGLAGVALVEDALVRTHGDAIERVASHLAAAHGEHDRAGFLDRLREAVGGTEGVVGAGVYEARGDGPGWTRIANHGVDGLPVVLTGGDTELGRRIVRIAAGDELLAVGVAVGDEGRYLVRVASSLAGIGAVEDRTRNLLIGLAALLVALGTLFADHLGRGFVGPLRELMHAMRDVTSGHFGRRLDTTHQDELGTLARRFNMMARAIERHREESGRHAEQLERRVSERTAALEHANRALRSLDRAKDAFLSNVSHEMRTPLTSILASIEILQNFDSDDPEERREFLTIVDAESKRLLALIDRVLEIVALEAAPLELRHREERLEDIVCAALGAAAGRAARRGVTLIRHGDSATALVRCDRDRIGGVLDGLLDNAIKFSPRGATIDVAVATDDHGVRIRIRDEGPGLSASDADGVFTKFVQLGASLTDKPQGFGLGLPLARRIAEAHGGSIDYEQEPGFGATFVLSLPALLPAEEDGPSAPAARAPAAPARLQHLHG
jgi:signal transduction histidine kinase